MQWIGSTGNGRRARVEDMRTEATKRGLEVRDFDAKVLEEPQGQVWQCPRCGSPLDLIAEHAFQELWECAQCGYARRLKQ